MKTATAIVIAGLIIGSAIWFNGAANRYVGSFDHCVELYENRDTNILYQDDEQNSQAIRNMCLEKVT